MRLLRRLRYFVQRQDRDLAEEMEFHRRMTEDRQRASGLSADEAGYAARRLMGNEAVAREDARRVWLTGGIESVYQDLRYAVRSLRSQPGFTAMALAALVLGLGLNTSLFTGINAILFRPWDVPDPSAVVKLHANHPRLGSTGFSVAASRHLNQYSRTLQGAFLWRSYPVALDQPADGPKSNAYFVSGNYFNVLDVNMAIGRPFSASEDVARTPAAVAVLSHAVWMQRYGADPAIVGRQVRIDDIPFIVIGVANRSFKGTSSGRSDLWAPLAALALARPSDPSISDFLTSPSYCCSEMAARLAPGVTRRQAQAELNTLFRQYASGSGSELMTTFRRSAPGAALEFEIVLTGTALLGDPDSKQRAAPFIALLLAAFGSILLLACANVSNLLLARAAARQREIAVRVAIGASRWRVVRQLLTESLLLAGIASSISLLLAFVIPKQILRFMGEELPANVHLTPDLNVLAYSVVIAMFAAVAFGLAPALRGTSAAVSDAMKRQDTHASPRFPLRGVLLAAQVAISVVMLIAAGLLLRGLDKARSVNPGFRTEAVTAIKVGLPVNSYDLSGQRAFLNDAVDQLQAQAGDRPVGISALVPLGDASNWGGFNPTGRGTDNPSMLAHSVNAKYFEVLGIPIIAGRNFLPGDHAGSVVLVNESLARRYWSGPDAVGQTVNIGNNTAEIVGIVRDAQLNRLGPPQPAYFGLFLGGSGSVVIVPAAFAAQAAATIRRLEARAVTEVIPLADRFYAALGDSRGAARIAGALGMLALLLSTVGVYGVISYSVEQRRKEIGIRMALGARPGEVVGMILRRNSRALLCGLAVGLALAAGASVVLEHEFYGTNPVDPLTYAGVLALLFAAGTAACVIPARRAAATDPLQALHHE